MEAFGVPRRIVAFVIPAGYSSISTAPAYLALASIFVAQAAGIQHVPVATTPDGSHAYAY
jgi:proton glutamate symport protein